MISRKVLITGSFAVGKTSLFNRFIHNTFSERYLTTIGVKVDKKEVSVNGQEVSLVLWDIAGEVSQEKVPRTYFLGASAVIYIFDLSRPNTLQNMEADLRIIQSALPGCLVQVVGNKKDLLDDEELLIMQRQVPEASTFTSAKTGENVEQLFFDIGSKLLEQRELD
ncbi:MAG: GTP-binding protein [Phaeodactylibacter sp.]|nr:GTP-binding protein [Phaeodactylibacter sp.]MCB9276333.1 GTP-binding protein [Lewinellaceae bacterium]